ncbi:C-GCAxxG-C-C family protein [uncultured Methanobrevibacter sp.]|uniref:C-GCAxxG-C-C family protein n=1 Tax=uncultured Methanobrevibacter sp. TaxID=253161 RepID=UPI0025DE245C|nr:C-GCAxxG-C-C family protein [uncultured Methanobrevibacter sp.]
MRYVEKSLKLFESKFNCAQAVFASFSKELGLDEKQALKIGGCFGSGMRKGEVCGACSGALMVIGLKYGQCEIGDVESKLKTDKMCVKFLERFESLNGSYICNELLNCDLKTEEGIEYAVNNNLFTEVCPKMVESATLIVEDLIRD